MTVLHLAAAGASAALFATVALPPLALAFSDGPPIGRAGEPGGSNCTVNCHSGVLNSGPGVLEILAPSDYQPGQTHDLEVRLTESGAVRWGFELVAFDSAHTQVGTLVASDADHTQLDSGYIMHTSAGTFAGTADGPVSWSFEWIAPGSDVGPVTFYAAGNAANNDGANTGDQIYTVSQELQVAVGVQSRNWSGLKRGGGR